MKKIFTSIILSIGIMTASIIPASAQQLTYLQTIENGCDNGADITSTESALSDAQAANDSSQYSLSYDAAQAEYECAFHGSTAQLKDIAALIYAANMADAAFDPNISKSEAYSRASQAVLTDNNLIQYSSDAQIRARARVNLKQHTSNLSLFMSPT
jgi:hypothetical protein